MKYFKLFIVLLSLSKLAYSLPAQHDFITQPERQNDSNLHNNYSFNGIARLNNCSGSLIHFEGQSMDSQALVLTNGHCYENGFINPGTAIINKSSSRRISIGDHNNIFHQVTTQKVLYATMTKTDAAIYQLKETYNDLHLLGITPFLLSPLHPEANTQIEIVSGYWRRGYSCAIDGFVYKMLEANWEWHNSIRYTDTGCDTIGGTSGSPVIAEGTHTVIGIHNTGNDDGEKCSMMNPCEISQNEKITVRKGTSYGQQTFIFYSCLNEQLQFDFSLEGCLLVH